MGYVVLSKIRHDDCIATPCGRCDGEWDGLNHGTKIVEEVTLTILAKICQNMGDQFLNYVAKRFTDHPVDDEAPLRELKTFFDEKLRNLGFPQQEPVPTGIVSTQLLDIIEAIIVNFGPDVNSRGHVALFLLSIQYDLCRSTAILMRLHHVAIRTILSAKDAHIRGVRQECMLMSSVHFSVITTILHCSSASGTSTLCSVGSNRTSR